LLPSVANPDKEITVFIAGKISRSQSSGRDPTLGQLTLALPMVVHIESLANRPAEIGI
jgi:hypothetical protein